MYDGGNLIGAVTPGGGSIVPYTGGVITNTTVFGPTGRYFTRKYPGLFTMVVDMDGVTAFVILGHLGANGAGTADGLVIEKNIRGVNYTAFVKRVYNAGVPSVNHIIIVAENPTAQHSFTLNTDQDFHAVGNLSSSDRIYYLLYAGANGLFINDTQTEAIMDAYIRALGIAPFWLSADTTSGTIPANDSQIVTVTLDAGGLTDCNFSGALNFTSNDPVSQALSVSVDLHVDVPPTCFTPNDTSVFVCAGTEVVLPVYAIDSCDPAGVTCEIISGPGELVGADWRYTPPSTEAINVVVRCTDAGGQFCESEFNVDFVFNQPPVCHVPNDTTLYLCDPVEVSFPVFGTDPDGNLESCKIVGGPGRLVGDEWRYTPVGDHTAFVTILCVDECGDSCRTLFKIKFDMNQVPQISCPPDTTLNYKESILLVTQTVDPDLATNPDGRVTYSLSNTTPDFAVIDFNSGRVTLIPQAKDICTHTVDVIARDHCGKVDTCSFNVCVTNNPPEISCVDTLLQACWGQTVSGAVSATDSDLGPISPTFSVLSFDGPGTVSINPVSGDFLWQTEEDSSYLGNFELCIKVTDGANICDSCSPSNADTCCIEMIVTPTYRISLETVIDAIQGGPVDQDIFLENSYESYPIAGFDFLISYDNSALSITGASSGDFVTGNNWEYFTYRFSPIGNCGSGCPSGKFRIVSLAQINHGSSAPTGYTNVSSGSDVLVTLHYQVSNDRGLGCQFTPVNWEWYDCGDNALASVSGDSLFISRYIYAPLVIENGELSIPNFGDGGANSIHGTDQAYPTTTGATNVCDTTGGPGKPKPIRKIDFLHGGIKIVCPDSIDARGDVNLNGLSNEIGDAVLFTAYFVQGITAFNINQEGQIAATEINGDGIPLTVADLVYLIRIIVGDALPLPRLTHHVTTAQFTTRGNTIATDKELGAALFVFSGQAHVSLLQSDLKLQTGVREGNTYALVTPKIGLSEIEATAIQPGEILQSNTELISVEAADYAGNALNTVTEILPTEFAVRQNYPNPFNPSTKFSFDLPEAAEYKITIFNVSGQKITEFGGYSSAGTVEVNWNAADLASGIYLYKISAGKQSMTRKMLLLK